MDFDFLAKAFERKNVIVIGDVMLDSYVYGQVSRISPEAPVPIVNVKRREERLGGAANVALNVAALGATPSVCSIVGSDIEGRTLERLFQQNNLKTNGMVRSPKRPTTVKHRILAASQHILRVDSEIDSQIGEQESETLFAFISDNIPQTHAIIFEDYDKGVLHPSLISQIVELANKHGVPTIVDPKKRNFLYYGGCSLFKPNLKELQDGLAISIDPTDRVNLSQAAQILAQKMPVEKLLLTLSENGVFITDYTHSHLIAAHKREISDVSGAGDTVVSIAALALACGVETKTLAELANLGGGLVCEQLGVVPISKERLFQEANRLLV